MTPVAARRGPVTVRTPQEATRDCFSISAAIACSRSIPALTLATSLAGSTSRKVTCARHAAATRRSPRHHEQSDHMGCVVRKPLRDEGQERERDSGEHSPHVDTASTSMRCFAGMNTSS